MDSSIETRPVGLRDRQKQQRERRIVKAAEKLFGRKGYAEVAMEDVAASGEPRSRAQSITISRPNRRYCLRSSGVKRNRYWRTGARSSTTHRTTLSRPRPRSPRFFSMTLRVTTGGCGANCSVPRLRSRPPWDGDFSNPTRNSYHCSHRCSTNTGTTATLASDIEAFPAATVLYGVCFTWMTAYLMNDAISAEMVRNEIRRGTAIAMRGLFPRAGAI